MEGRRRRNSHRTTGIHFTFKKAQKLSTTRHSCVVEVPHEMSLTMSPKFIPNIRDGLKETLDKSLLMYDKDLQGVPLAYNHIKVVSSQIIDDLEVFKLNIKLTFIVFRPEAGKLLNGVVNKITDSNFGCIIHECINASVRQPERRVLSESQKSTIDNITIGATITFKIWKFDVHHGIMIVLGDIYSECYQRIRRYSQSCSENESTAETISQLVNGAVPSEVNGLEKERTTSTYNGDPDATPKRKKKKKKRSAEEPDGSTSQDSEASPKKKKKKKSNVLGSDSLSDISVKLESNGLTEADLF